MRSGASRLAVLEGAESARSRFSISNKLPVNTKHLGKVVIGIGLTLIGLRTLRAISRVVGGSKLMPRKTKTSWMGRLMLQCFMLLVFPYLRSKLSEYGTAHLLNRMHIPQLPDFNQMFYRWIGWEK